MDRSELIKLYWSNEAFDKYASCSALEFQSLFSNPDKRRMSLGTFYLSLLGEDRYMNELHEKLLFLISLEREDESFSFLHECLENSVPTNAISYIVKNGVSINRKNKDGLTPLVKSMFLDTVDEDGGIISDIGRQNVLFQLLLQHGGEMRLQDFSQKEKQGFVEELKTREDLFGILKENQLNFTTSQKEDWDTIRLHFVC